MTAKDRKRSQQIKIYPNPVLDYIYYDMDPSSNGKLSLKLIDINGKLLKSKMVITGQNQINVNDLPASIYYL